MIIEQTFTVGAPKSDVAEFLLQPERMLYCVPGVKDVRPTDSGAYAATLEAKVGPIRAAFSGEVTIDDNAGPDHIVATGEGRDRASGSMAKVVLNAQLDDTEPNLTTITSHADVTIRGRLGQFGTGVIQAIAGEMVGQFATCVEATLTNDADPERQSTDVRTPGIASIAVRGMAKGAAAKVDALRRREKNEGA